MEHRAQVKGIHKSSPYGTYVPEIAGSHGAGPFSFYTEALH